MHRRQRRVEDNGARSRIDFVLMSKLLNNSPNNFDLADAGGDDESTIRGISCAVG